MMILIKQHISYKRWHPSDTTH
uniref:Uncharacterized protein n=1 Tax=Arundo donax TaxID=35708 RepID=A0A0A8Y7M9_ARUDO